MIPSVVVDVLRVVWFQSFVPCIIAAKGLRLQEYSDLQVASCTAVSAVSTAVSTVNTVSTVSTVC